MFLRQREKSVTGSQAARDVRFVIDISGAAPGNGDEVSKPMPGYLLLVAGPFFSRQRRYALRFWKQVFEQGAKRRSF